MINEIEMNDLLGHTEDIMSSAEMGAQHKETTSHYDKSKPRSSCLARMNCYHILVILVFLLGATVFVFDEIYIFREGTSTRVEPDKKQYQNTNDEENYKDEALQFDRPNNPETAKEKDELANVSPREGSNCVDDPSFQFRKDPKKNCDWVAKNHIEVCNIHHESGPFVRDACPLACGDCFIEHDQEIQIEEIGNIDFGCEKNPLNCQNITNAIIEDAAGEHQVSQETNGENNDDQITIVDGIDDKEVYCEDLSQYQEWHKIKITKNDALMYRIVNQMNHDGTSFTQGLTYARGKLFESAGLFGKSTVRILDRNSAVVEKKVSMENRLFAEGITYYNDTLVQITWRSQRGFIYNLTNLREINSFKFETTFNEGWGITWDRCNDELIVTDGSENLHFWDPNTMTEIRRVSVRRIDGSDAKKLNEIEFWRGRVLANVWYEDVILVINPETGVVEKEYDFSQLWPKSERRIKKADVLNGISISENPSVLYVTGKLWDRMYGIQLLPEL